MSQENVEVVRWFFGDTSRFFEVLDEQVELDIRPMTPGYQEIIHGKDAVIDFWRDYIDTWDEITFELIEIREAGEDQVVVIQDQRGRGKGSGASFELRSGTIFTLRAGRLVRMRFFATPEAALEAAGLRE
jgi:ketosteroid isomerase-like protein